MSEIFLRLFSWLLFSGLIFSQVSNPDTISVTVYNDNLGVIKESRTISLTKGFNSIEIGNVAAKIDPTSVRFTFAGNVLEQNYQYDLASFTKILKRYYNKDVTLIGDKGDVITGTLLSVEDREAVIRVADSGLMLLPYISGYRISVGDLPEGLITTPTLKVDLSADKEGSQNLELAYMTEGLNWHAEYVAVLDTDDKKMDLNAWVSIENNSGITFKNTSLKLVAGELNLLENKSNNRLNSGIVIQELEDRPQFNTQSFFEYYIYKLQRLADIPNNSIKQIQLFEAGSIPVTKKYQVYSSAYSSPGKRDVNIMIEFTNTTKAGLGIPFPRGVIRIYKSDGNSLEFIGEDKTKHIPRNEMVVIKTGNAFDMVAEETLETDTTISERVRELTLLLKIRNRKKEPVSISYIKTLASGFQIIDSDLPPNKLTSESIELNIPVPADSVINVKYTIRYTM